MPSARQAAIISALTPEVKLTGRYRHKTGPVDVRGVMDQIDDARFEDDARRLRMQTT